MPELYDKLNELAQSDYYPFHMPGHKRNEQAAPFGDIFDLDITEIDEYDNLHDASGIIKNAQDRANKLYGADDTFFLVNGSTCGILSSIFAVCKDYDKLVTSRNCHKSLYHAAYLRKLDLKFVFPEYLNEYGFFGKILPEKIEEVITEDTKAVFITSPTYEGIVSDIESIVKIAHTKKIPVIVDEAHGAHFAMDKSMPQSALEAGADIVIHSVHKTTAAMTQTALLHVQGNIVDRGQIRRYLRIFQSSSPSYVLMASIDNAVEEMEKNGHLLSEKLNSYNEKIIKKTQDCRYINVLGKDLIDDPGKIVICVRDDVISGEELYKILREKFHLQMEMAGEKHVLAIITGYDSSIGIDRLVSALNEIDAELVNKSKHILNSVNKVTIRNKTSKRNNSEQNFIKEDNSTEGDFIKGANSIEEDDFIKEANSIEGDFIKGANSKEESNFVKEENFVKTEDTINKTIYTVEDNLDVISSYGEIIKENASRGNSFELPEKKLSIFEAWDKNYNLTKIDDAVGLISGDFVNLYPPGIPLIVPGEIISKAFINSIKEYIKKDMNIQGIVEDRYFQKCLKTL
ncbi:MAG: aminotransferase class V-fold PLP-dependent enzyme [Butyrivibrio sp.]|nr:aminotransferase class V-fold PLP-dependent enzyme [Butyrivibrio sp.]